MMIQTTLFSAALALALQPAANEAPAEGLPESFKELPAEEAAAPRCGVAFAVVQGWQQAGVKNAEQWPPMEASGGKEFFVQAMAQLMEKRELQRGQLNAMVQKEVAQHLIDDGKELKAMMPACLAMLKASGTQ